MKKVTKAMRNSDIIALLEGKPTQYGTTIEEAVAHLTRENELLSKKNSGTAKKPTKVQVENESHKENILVYLGTLDGEGASASEVADACNLTSNQKAAALLNALSSDGKVRREVEKGKPKFYAA